MAQSPKSWSAVVLRRYCLYLASAVAALPAGLGYAAVVQHGLETWWTVLLALIAGVFLAHLGWTLANRKLIVRGAGASGVTYSKPSLHPTVQSR